MIDITKKEIENKYIKDAKKIATPYYKSYKKLLKENGISLADFLQEAYLNMYVIIFQLSKKWDANLDRLLESARVILKLRINKQIEQLIYDSINNKRAILGQDKISHKDLKGIRDRGGNKWLDINNEISAMSYDDNPELIDQVANFNSLDVIRLIPDDNLACITKVLNDQECYVVRQYIVYKMTFKEIGVKISQNWQNVRRIYQTALKKLKKSFSLEGDFIIFSK